MAIALDVSTPARWSSTLGQGAAATSASFTAPSGAFLVLCIEMDGTNAQNPVFNVSDTGTLTWTQQVARTWGETTDGGSAWIFTAITASATSRTISATRTSANTGTAMRLSAVCYVFTGVDTGGTPVDTVTASNEGGSATNNLTTTSVTPGATGVLVVAGCEFNALGACGSSDLKGVDGNVGTSHAEYAGAIDVLDGWKACTSGVGVTGNLDAAGTGAAQWKWCQIVVRQASGGVAFIAEQNQVITQAVKRAAYW